MKILAILLVFVLVGCEKPEFVGQENKEIEIPVAPELVKKPLFAPPFKQTPISQKSKDLIIYFEMGSRSYYDRVTTHPVWPNTMASGVTTSGYYDCGYYSKSVIYSDWKKIREDWLKRIANTSGIKGYAARDLVKTMKDISISWDLGIEVFDNVILSRYYELALRTFPGMDDLHPDARGVLVSLVLNRGGSLSGDRRREMRAIRDMVPKKDYSGMANEIRKMKRLWYGKGVDGLLLRRDKEADLMAGAR